MCKQHLTNFTFPKNSQNRSFQHKWLLDFVWLEYSKVADAAFCYACRHFSTGTSDIFTTTGFRNWAMALSEGRGLKKHDKSDHHCVAMSAWSEKKARESKGSEVSTLLSANVLQRRRLYMKAIVRTLMFLAKNELALRGNWNAVDENENGLFNTLFEFLLSENPTVKEAERSLPAHLNYRSPEIQNQIVEAAAFCLRREIATEINAAPFFTVMVDGYRDKNGAEVLSIAFRYVSKFTVKETLLDFICIDNLNAKAIAAAILGTMDKFGLDKTKLISQCYDGAAVMSGKKGGVQKIIADKLERRIPFIHCFNHRLHLVIIDAVSSIQIVKEFFDYIRAIHNFFSLFHVKKEYEGTSISRLLPTRWSGHYQATKSRF